MQRPPSPNSSWIIGLLAWMAVACWSDLALADRCDNAVSEFNGVKHKEEAEMRRQQAVAEAVIRRTGQGSPEALRASCDYHRWHLRQMEGFWKKGLALIAICGEDRLTHHCNASCVQSQRDTLTRKVQSDCQAAEVASPSATPPKDCKPTARVEPRTEFSGADRNTFEVVVVTNDCPYPVRFTKTITQKNGGGSKDSPTGCAPAKRSAFELKGDRTSSTSMAIMQVSPQAAKCN